MGNKQKPNKLERELMEALEKIRPMAGAPHDFTIADVWNAQQKADTALGRYKRERAP